MQQPPRKGNYTKFLKNLHTEQLAKLQLKNQHECDLLEDIRTFVIKRSAIEKQYSEALLKVASSYLNKKSPSIPEIKMDGADEKWNMWNVWTTVLEENEKLARARLAAVEVLHQDIADETKILRAHKLGISKRSVEGLGNIQRDLQQTVQDVDKTKKSYFDEEHCAHDVRDKARDIEEKLKKKKGSFFQSITSLQKNSARVTSRKEQLEEKSTGARNDYILSLASANSHQNRYFTTDLQTTMQIMEFNVYDRIADFLALIGRTELLTCSATQNSFGKICNQANQLTREYNLQCVYLYYPVLKQHIQYEFEPCDNDPVRKITAEHDTVLQTLNHEGKRWAARVARENHSIRENSRRLAACQALRDNGHRTDPNDQNGPDLDTKMEELREQIRKSSVAKLKAEAKLECLKQGGISIEEWLQEAETLSIQEIPRSSSDASLKTDASRDGDHPSSDSFYDSDNAEVDTKHQKQALQATTSNKSVDEKRDTYHESFNESSEFEDDEDDKPFKQMPQQQQQQSVEQFAAWEDPTSVDWGTEKEEPTAVVETIPSSTSSTNNTVQTYKCTALYSYTAQNPDELTIVENEQLEVVGEGDGDGWLRARNYRGEEGFVPHNYLDVERDVPTNEQQTQMAAQISFSSVDYTVDNEDQEVLPDSVQSPDQVSVISAPVKKKSDQLYCIALYDYDATAEDELTFEEGQIIKLITKEPHGVDDGWWEGALDGKIGNFPSLVVDECDENGEPLTEPEEEEEDDEDYVAAPAGFGLPPTVPPHLLSQEDLKLALEQSQAQTHSSDRKMDLDLSQPPKFAPPSVNIICENKEVQYFVFHCYIYIDQFTKCQPFECIYSKKKNISPAHSFHSYIYRSIVIF
ncbi:hypothetical protein ACKWTF_003837 [Chironomus riparius]